jgi:hypothetical protein
MFLLPDYETDYEKKSTFNVCAGPYPSSPALTPPGTLCASIPRVFPSTTPCSRFFNFRKAELKQKNIGSLF